MSVTLQVADSAPQVSAEAIRPTGSRVLVRRLKTPEKTRGGIYLTDERREVSQIGQVLAVGPGEVCPHCETLIVPDVTVGQLVVFSIYAATPCIATQDFAEDLVFVRARDLLAVWEGS